MGLLSDFTVPYGLLSQQGMDRQFAAVQQRALAQKAYQSYPQWVTVTSGVSTATGYDPHSAPQAPVRKSEVALLDERIAEVCVKL